MKARRGDVRAAILAVLAEQPMNGYQIIQEIAERSGGAWKPSPGSIYPTLQQLEDEGLVRAETDKGRRAFTLTDEGRADVAEHADEVAAPWQTLGETLDDGLKPLIGQVGAAFWQIMAVGSAEQQAQGREALVEFHNRLDAILSPTTRPRATGHEPAVLRPAVLQASPWWSGPPRVRSGSVMPNGIRPSPCSVITSPPAGSIGRSWTSGSTRPCGRSSPQICGRCSPTCRGPSRLRVDLTSSSAPPSGVPAAVLTGADAADRYPRRRHRGGGSVGLLGVLLVVHVQRLLGQAPPSLLD